MFASLGYATYHVKNPSSAMIEALIQVLKEEIEFPETYRRFFLYYTGHGTENCIVTHDGYVPINFLKQSLWPSHAPKLAEIPKILLFDCCRGTINGESVLENKALVMFRLAFSDVNELSGVSNGHGLVGNVLVFYTTHLHFQAFARLNGVGIATTELMKLLQRKESRSLLDVLQSDLYKAYQDVLRGEPEEVRVKSSQVHPVVEGSLEEQIDLYKEKVKASESS